ncbi:MAG TPA: glycosyl hydrolase [Flavisolibacter sp.]|nr:glycosyl hydrolase [Flavisolibacter sp.]
MRYNYLFLVFAFLLSANVCSSQATFSKNAFLNPPNSVKVHAWWHWVDDAITKEGITKDLESMKKGGISQATILNVSLFNQKDFGVPQIKFNTPEWYRMFQWSLKEANRLGITLGAHNCDGWSSSGGPWITPEKSMKQFVWTKTTVSGGKPVSLFLKKPFAKDGFYRDVAVVAYRTTSTPNSFQLAKPTAKLNDSADAAFLFDGSPSSTISLNKGNHITVLFPASFTADKVVIHPRRQFMWSDMANFQSNYSLSSSNDGVTFQKVTDIVLTGLNQSFETAIPATSAKYFRLVLNDYANTDSWFGYHVAEVELLRKEEKPAFAPAIAHLLEKTVSIKSQSPDYFNTAVGQLASDEVDAKDVIDITANMAADGTLGWQAPEGNWRIVRFGYTTTGATNAPATKEGIGLECDKMDIEALTFHFNSFSQKLVDAAGAFAGNTFKFLLVDSWECGYQNWTKNLPAEFKKRRGYNLNPFIPVLCGDPVGGAVQSDAFLYDFRKTIAELIEENYYKPLSELCHKNKLEFHSEVIYGDANYPPLDILRSNSYVDLPMFEFWAGYNRQSMPEYHPTVTPEASFPVYSAPLYNKPVVGAEAYTGYAHYSESPWDLKPYGDRAYCSGINQLILHSYVHQPTDKKPGMTLGGFAAHFNRNNPWWQFASSWIDYQSRVQYFLQKGETVSDILFFVGDQLPQYVENPFLKDLPFGYRANACNKDVLQQGASVRNAKIIVGENQQYSLLVLPDNQAMELETLQRVSQLVKEGATVYGPKPTTTFSMHGQQNVQALNALANEVWGNATATSGSHNYGKGRVFWGTSVANVLREIQVGPDFGTGKSDSLNLMYIHKKLSNADVYFVFNQQNEMLQRNCAFRVPGKRVEIWNPQYGSVSVVNSTAENDGLHVEVTFHPREALIFVVTNSPAAAIAGSPPPQTFTINDFKGELRFRPAYAESISSQRIQTLKSYTEFADSSIRYFAGTAHYTIHFDNPSTVAKGDSVLLSLGNIEATAEVRLNKKLLGFVWMPDFKMNVTGLLQPKNDLEITVATAYRNRIVGDFRQYGMLKNTWTSANVADVLDKNKVLKPSGAMGPLQLIVYKRKSR